jgi:ABC-type nickel/cobalt efflux system permease component RcnA
MGRLLRRLAVTGVAVAGLLALPAAAAWAHPLGNFTENRADAIVVGAHGIEVEHVLDLAEIPTLQARPTMDANADGSVSAAELVAYAATSCRVSAATLSLSVDGRPLPLVVGATSARLIPGQAGLFTLRLQCALTAEHQATGSDRLTFSDQDRPGTVGWREVTIASDGTTLEHSSAPTTSPSKELRAYPTDALASPVDVSSATATYHAGGAALGRQAPVADAASAVLPGGIDTLTSWLSSAASGADGTWTYVLAILIAVGVGAAHAVAPGHGKSIMAFYLAGRAERSLRAATQVALTVTATHTVGVLVLGLLVGTFATITPANLYPWLTAASGVLVVGVGITLVRFALRARRLAHGHDHGHEHPHGHDHSHGHDHPHAHPHAVVAPSLSAPAAPAAVAAASPVAVLEAESHPHPHPDPHPHPHPHPHPDPQPAQPGVPGGRRGLIALGIAGGLVPSPSALVVLLGTAALGRAWFGVLLVLAFGTGMAITLACAGLVAHRAATGFGRLAAAGRRPWIARVATVLPLLTASAVITVGASLALRGLVAV